MVEEWQPIDDIFAREELGLAFSEHRKFASRSRMWNRVSRFLPRPAKREIDNAYKADEALRKIRVLTTQGITEQVWMGQLGSEGIEAVKNSVGSRVGLMKSAIFG